MPTELFIQDIATHGKRLEKILYDHGWTNWEFFEPNDIVVQEHSFSAGRIDILATFNKRTKLLVIEVKNGTANKYCIDQLTHYLDHSADLIENLGDLVSVDDPDNDTKGLLIAESFFLPQNYDQKQKIFFTEFSLNDGDFPFRQAQIQPCDPDEEIPTYTKSSTLKTIEDHRERITVTELQEAYDTLSQAFLKADDPRTGWLVRNPKNDYMWIKYKSIGVICLWPRRKYIAMGYRDSSGGWNSEHIHSMTDIMGLEIEIKKTMDSIDRNSNDTHGLHWSMDGLELRKSRE